MIHPPTLGVVLAGGQGRRMGGGDKVLLDLAGKPLLQHVIDRFVPQVDSLVLNANGDPSRFAVFGRPVVADGAGAGAGPLAGLLAGFDWAAAHEISCDVIAIVPGDSPFVPVDLVERLVAAGQGGAAIAASDGRSHPVFGIFPVHLADSLRAFLDAGHRKAGDWASQINAQVVSFESNQIDPFFNINTPEDLEHATRLATAGGLA